MSKKAKIPAKTDSKPALSHVPTGLLQRYSTDRPEVSEAPPVVR